MKYDSFRGIIFLVFFCANCVKNSDSDPTPPPTISNLTPLPTQNGATLPAITGNNVLPLSVNSAPCAAYSYFNKPCVSVTVCSPTGTNCQTISDILLDTGSFGLRIFKSAFPSDPSAALTPVQVASQPLAECAQFGDGSMEWGSVRLANIVLANEPPVMVPMQLIDASYATYRANTICANAEAAPAQAGLNGILGVGLFLHDCGTNCVTNANNQVYYSCNGTNCTESAVPLTSQVQNPVALLGPDTATVGNPQDNNGLVLMLPSVPTAGATSIRGYVVLGIATRSNNNPNGATIFHTDANGNIVTAFNNATYTAAFLDSGSNALFFPATGIAALVDCGSVYNGQAAGWYCPNTGLTLSANTEAGLTHATILFQVGSLAVLANTGNSVFSDIASDLANGYFDWGLPFFIGRNVFVGFEGRSSSLGSGMYWAY